MRVFKTLNFKILLVTFFYSVGRIVKADAQIE